VAPAAVSLKPKIPTKTSILYVNSPVGSVLTTVSVFLTQMQHIKPDVQTVMCRIGGPAWGLFCSMLAPQAKRKQPCTNSRTMIHQPLGGCPAAQASDIRIQADEISSQRQAEPGSWQLRSRPTACTDRAGHGPRGLLFMSTGKRPCLRTDANKVIEAVARSGSQLNGSKYRIHL